MTNKVSTHGEVAIDVYGDMDTTGPIILRRHHIWCVLMTVRSFQIYSCHEVVMQRCSRDMFATSQYLNTCPCEGPQFQKAMEGNDMADTCVDL